MNKIKIIHIAQANGGVERYLKMFIKKFNDKRYINCLILSNEYIKCKYIFDKLGVKVYFVDMKRELNIVNDLKSSIEIYKILKLEKPNIVYTHSSKAGGLGRIPAKLLGCINFYNPHGWAFDMDTSAYKKFIFKNIEKILSRITTKVIAISKYEKELAINKNICPEDKILVIENAIDIDININVSLKKLREKLNFNNDDIIVGMVARVSKQKSPKTFVEIASKLKLIDNRFKFIIVGDGEEREKIEDIIKKYNLKEDVYITGWVDNPEEYIGIFDVALLTSVWEGFGLVIPEYMVQNKPVIASNVGGISNIINNGIDGFLIDNLDVDEFVKYICLVVNNLNIKEYIVKNAFEKVKLKYDFNRVIAEHLELFEEYF